MTPYIFHLRLGDGWFIFMERIKNMGISLYHQLPVFNKYFLIVRHGLTRQGQKTRTVKPRLRFGKVALYPELGKLALCQPHKQARAKGKKVLINTTQHSFGGVSLVPKRKDQNQLTGEWIWMKTKKQQIKSTK